MIVSPEVRLTLCQHFNRNVTHFPNIEWTDDVETHFPEKNNHNTPYYKVNKVFPESLVTWVVDRASNFEQTLPFFQNDTGIEIIPTKSNRCSRCNRNFNENRSACIIVCACFSKKKTVKIQCCIRCALVQWLLQGCCETNHGSDS